MKAKKTPPAPKVTPKRSKPKEDEQPDVLMISPAEAAKLRPKRNSVLNAKPVEKQVQTPLKKPGPKGSRDKNKSIPGPKPMAQRKNSAKPTPKKPVQEPPTPRTTRSSMRTETEEKPVIVKKKVVPEIKPEVKQENPAKKNNKSKVSDESDEDSSSEDSKIGIIKNPIQTNTPILVSDSDLSVKSILSHQRFGRRGIEYTCMLDNDETIKLTTMAFKKAVHKKLLEKYKKENPDLQSRVKDMPLPVDNGIKRSISSLTVAEEMPVKKLKKDKNIDICELAVSENEYFVDLITTMMFASGDSKKPLPRNIERVTNIVKNELIEILRDAREMKKFFIEFGIDKKPDEKIRLEHIMGVLAGQKSLLQRILKFVETRLEMARGKYLKNNAETTTAAREKKTRRGGYESDDDDDEADQELDDVEDYEVDDNTRSKKIEKDENLLDALKKAMRIAGINYDNVKAYRDENLLSRDKTLFECIKNMSAEDYEKLAEAKSVSFLNNPLLRNRNCHGNFVMWLGSPPIGEHVDFVLSFVAKQTVLELVAEAAVIRKLEPQNVYRNDGSTNSLQERHYEWAIMRNINFNKYRRIFAENM